MTTTYSAGLKKLLQNLTQTVRNQTKITTTAKEQILLTTESLSTTPETETTWASQDTPGGNKDENSLTVILAIVIPVCVLVIIAAVVVIIVIKRRRAQSKKSHSEQLSPTDSLRAYRDLVGGDTLSPADVTQTTVVSHNPLNLKIDTTSKNETIQEQEHGTTAAKAQPIPNDTSTPDSPKYINFPFNESGTVHSPSADSTAERPEYLEILPPLSPGAAGDDGMVYSYADTEVKGVKLDASQPDTPIYEIGQPVYYNTKS